MKNVPRGLIIAILVGMLAGLTLGFFVITQSNYEQLVFQEGYSISIVTEKIDFELGEQINIKIVNSGTMPLTFSDSSYGLRITGLDGVFTYFVATKDSLGMAKDTMAAKPLVLYESDDLVAMGSEEIAIRSILPQEITTYDPFDGEVKVWQI